MQDKLCEVSIATTKPGMLTQDGAVR